MVIIIRIIHTFLFFLILVLTYIIGTSVTVCFSVFSKDKTKPFQIAANIWSRFLIPFSGVRIKVSGSENIPKNKPVVFASNHQGAADILILLATLPIGFLFAPRKELFRIPIFGWYLKKAGYFLIDREAILAASKTVEKMSEIIKKGKSILIFPEGTRTRDGSLRKFKPGSLLMALKSGAPVVPIAISGSFNIMPRGTWLINPQSVKVSIGKPIFIQSEKEYPQKLEEVREVIQAMLL